MPFCILVTFSETYNQLCLILFGFTRCTWFVGVHAFTEISLTPKGSGGHPAFWKLRKKDQSECRSKPENEIHGIDFKKYEFHVDPRHHCWIYYIGVREFKFDF